MNILQVCSAASLGGGERHVIDLTRALIERGHQLHLAIRPASPLLGALAGWPVRFHELPLRNSIDLPSALRLAMLISREKIDVLHAHVGRDYIVSGLAAHLNPRVRYLITRHHFNSFRANPLLRWALARADHLIAVSTTVYQRFEAVVPELTASVKIIPNWVDPQLYLSPNRSESRRNLGITRPLAVGIIGQISPLKGQDIFVEAAQRLLAGTASAGKTDELAPEEIEFLVIGSPDPADRPFADALLERVRTAGLSASIRFPGFIDNLQGQLAGLDLVVILSENEAFSLVLVEAMAAGLPVIATRVGGMAEILLDQQTGVFIERSPTALTAAICKLARDPNLRRQLAVRAREEVQRRFSRKNVIDQIEQLLICSPTPGS